MKVYKIKKIKKIKKIVIFHTASLNLKVENVPKFDECSSLGSDNPNSIKISSCLTNFDFMMILAWKSFMFNKIYLAILGALIP
jgi:hypothetical protein